MEIRHLKHNEIDIQKWDEALLNSENARIYANSWYLNLVSPEWEAFVSADYDYIFPLPVKKKLGIKYIVQPLYAQQLGLFYKEKNEAALKLFEEKLISTFRRITLRLNSDNESSFVGKSERRNYILPITSGVELRKCFSENTRRNIKKAESFTFQIVDNVDVSEFLELKKKHSRADLSEKNWRLMQDLIKELIKQNCGFFKGIYSGNELLSAVFFSRWKNRLCYLFSASSEKGKEMRLSFAIVNSVLLNTKNEEYILDFEGSMDDNIARFFKGFGAKEEKYFQILKKF